MRKSAATIILIIATLVGCSGAARQKTILTALITVDAAKDAYVSFDLQHQQMLVDNAKTREEAEAKVAEWRKTQTRIVAMFEAAYDAMKVALNASDDKSLASMTGAVAALVDAILEVKKAGSP